MLIILLETLKFNNANPATNKKFLNSIQNINRRLQIFITIMYALSYSQFAVKLEADHSNNEITTRYVLEKLNMKRQRSHSALEWKIREPQQANCVTQIHHDFLDQTPCYIAAGGDWTPWPRLQLAYGRVWAWKKGSYTQSCRFWWFHFELHESHRKPAHLLLKIAELIKISTS
jgi:hypothetical protein